MSLFSVVCCVWLLFTVAHSETVACGGSVTGTLSSYTTLLIEFSNPTGHEVTFTTCQSSFDTRLYVYDAANNWISNEICAGDDCFDADYPCTNNARETITLGLSAGTYTLRLEGYKDTAGAYVVEAFCGAETTLVPTSVPTPATPSPTQSPTTPSLSPTPAPTPSPSPQPTPVTASAFKVKLDTLFCKGLQVGGAMCAEP